MRRIQCLIRRWRPPAYPACRFLHRPNSAPQSAPTDRQPRCNSGTIEPLMKILMQQIEPDYYRTVQLVIAHAEFRQLRQWRVGAERRSKIPLGKWRSPDGSRQAPGRIAIVQ